MSSPCTLEAHYIRVFITTAPASAHVLTRARWTSSPSSTHTSSASSNSTSSLPCCTQIHSCQGGSWWNCPSSCMLIKALALTALQLSLQVFNVSIQLLSPLPRRMQLNSLLFTIPSFLPPRSNRQGSYLYCLFRDSTSHSTLSWVPLLNGELSRDPPPHCLLNITYFCEIQVHQLSLHDNISQRANILSYVLRGCHPIYLQGMERTTFGKEVLPLGSIGIYILPWFSLQLIEVIST